VFIRDGKKYNRGYTQYSRDHTPTFLQSLNIQTVKLHSNYNGI